MPTPIDPRIEKLHVRMTGTREKAAGTIASYTEVSRKFLATIRANHRPDRSDVDRYVSARRKGDISERTLLKEFHAIHKLFLANDWEWTLTKDDAPLPGEQSPVKYIRIEDVHKLIRASPQFSKAERFYLAVATTWIVRREDLSRIVKRDFDDKVFKIQTSKHGKVVRAPIPEALRTVFAEFRPRGRETSTLSLMFNAMCKKAGIERPEGGGWHALRYTLTSVLTHEIPLHQLDPAIMSDYCGWQTRKLASVYGGAEMIGLYRHPEIVEKDPFAVFRKVYAIHPFLKTWAKVYPPGKPPKVIPQRPG